MSEPAALEIDIDDALRRWPERKDRWLYLAVPDAYTARLDALLVAHPRGFRSVPVTVAMGRESWRSGAFRYRDGTWAVPIRRSVRDRHRLDRGDRMRVRVVVELTPPSVPLPG